MATHERHAVATSPTSGTSHHTIGPKARPMGIPFRFQTAESLGFSQVETTWSYGSAGHDVDGGVASEERDCGNCHACCIHLPIPAGEVCANAKPAGVVCQRLADHGCQIYQSRPTTCRQFMCVWATEPSWPLDWRPERSGLLCLCEEIEQGISAALVYELERGAIERATTEPILEKLKESTVLVALVNSQRQRRLLRGHQWVDLDEHEVGRPHFLKPIHAIRAKSPESLRDVS